LKLFKSRSANLPKLTVNGVRPGVTSTSPFGQSGRKTKRTKLNLAIYGGILFVLVIIAAAGYRSPSLNADNSQTTATVTTTTDNSAMSQTGSGGIAAGQTAAPAASNSGAITQEQVQTSDLAATAATAANLSVANSVSSQAISLNTIAALDQSSTSVANKPQIIDTSEEDSAVLKSYTVVEGDTANSVAAKFGITVQTLKWANNLTADQLAVGTSITVPALDGVVYTVKDGDNLNTVADKYKSDATRIAAVNDLVDNQLPATGTRILLPGGVLPENEQPGYVAPTTRVSYTTTRNNFASGGNCLGRLASLPDYPGAEKYAYGNCTRYAYNRRAELGKPVGSMWGNACSWAASGRAAGFRVDNTPEFGAVFVENGWCYGHVGVVESVNSDGSITISEMNNYGCGGYNIVNLRRVTNPGDYLYVH
jgi:surface antigen